MICMLVVQWLDWLSIGAAITAALVAIWPTSRDVPRITVNHRDALPQYLRLQNKRAWAASAFALVAALVQGVAMHLRP